jgi:hypothetical protein
MGFALLLVLRLSAIYFFFWNGNHMSHYIYKLLIGRPPRRTGDVWKLHRFFFPLCWRASRRSRTFPNQLFVGQPFAKNGTCGFLETFPISQFPFIEPKRLLV